MAAHAFDYADYHRTIIAFHGTTEETADRLVCGEPFNISESDDDWFGQGVYFWEYAPKQAWWWARKFKKFVRPAVVGAIIRLGNCFDLLDPKNVKFLKGFHDSLIARFQEAGQEIPATGAITGISIAWYSTTFTKIRRRPESRSIQPERSTSRQHSPNEFGPGVGFMKKRTSKSVSATPETSSPSGTSAQTDATANNQPKKPRGVGKFAYIVDHLNQKSRQEFLESLVRIGIYDEDGNLTEKYGGKKRVSKEKPRDEGEKSASAGAPSKPAPVTRKTSSPSGTSAQTDATADKPPQGPDQTGNLACLVEALNKLPPAELRQSLVAAGIIDEEDKLTEQYRQPTKKGKGKRAS